MIRLNIVFYNENIYTIVMGKSNVGIMWETGEVLKCNMLPQDLVCNINVAISRGNILVPQPAWEELGRMTVTEKAVGIRGWRKMTRLGVIMCVIDLYEDKLILWWSDPADIQRLVRERMEAFPADYPIESLAGHLVTVARQRQADFASSSSGHNSSEG